MPSQLKCPAEIVVGVIPQTWELLYKCRRSYLYSGKVILHMAKSSPRAFLEERGPQGSCCAGEGLEPPMSWASCGTSRRGAQPMQGLHPLPFSILLSSLWYLLALLQDGHEHIWLHLATSCPGGGSRVWSCLPSLLLTPFHPGTHLGSWAPGNTGRLPLGWPCHLALGKGTSGWKQGSSLYRPFLLSSPLPCFSHSKSLTEQYRCAKESLTHLQLQGCQLTPPYLPPHL